MDLTLNTQQAREAGNISERITESGYYEGIITRAELVTSKQGTRGVELAIKTDDGATADYLSLWMKNASGDELYGLKAVQSLLVCLKLRACPAGEIHAMKFDKSANKSVDTLLSGYPAMMDKRIGLVLQKELYSKNDGKEGEKFNIISFAEAGTRYSAAEILDKAIDAVAIEKALHWLEKNPTKDGRKKPSATHTPAMRTVAAEDGFDNDIPF